jgi:hypothetical protein
MTMVEETEEMVTVGFPSPPSFSVVEFVRMVMVRGYTNRKYDYDFEELLDRVPDITKKYSNDILAKAILSHSFGEMLAKDFRNWIRSQMDESLEYADGGASIGPDGEEA